MSPDNTLRKLFVTNWKMYKSFNTCYAWYKENRDQLIEIASKTNLVVCPEFTVLWRIKELFKSSDLHIGAQNCASEFQGAYTGEVSVESLSDIGCTFCLIGHSERRLSETPTSLRKKTVLLLSQGITPIICMGESHQEKLSGHTVDVLKTSMDSLLDTLNEHDNSPINVCVAYEPAWAIGSDLVPPLDYLSTIFELLASYKNMIKKSCKLTLLYGGNVSSKTITTLRKNPLIEGYLIGRSSLDIQELKKIVSLG